MDVIYLGKKEFSQFNHSGIMGAYQRNNLSIVVKNDVWWFERCKSEKIFYRVKEQMKVLYPKMQYLNDGNFSTNERLS